jgi:hypothetical protein
MSVALEGVVLAPDLVDSEIVPQAALQHACTPLSRHSPLV